MATSKQSTITEWDSITIPLVKLHLDLENYRHEKLNSEEEVIRYLLDKEKVEALARDIAEHGSTSPLDRIGVFPMRGNPEHYVAVEGNRRVCALLLLHDPERAPEPAQRKLFAQLARLGGLPSTVDVVRFPSKAKAKHWVDLRHLGEQDGRGPRSWDNTQKNRAAGERATDPLALALLERAAKGNWLPPGETPKPTTLTRYLKNREVRASLGLGHHRLLQFTHDPAEVDVALRQFLLDALPTSDGSLPRVNSRSKDPERASYARDLRTRGVAPTTVLSTPMSAPEVDSSNVRPQQRGTKRDPFKRPHLVPTGFKMPSEDTNLRALFAEMRRTPIDHHEFACNYLLRAFVERVMAQYVRSVDPGFNWSNEQALSSRCVQLLDPESKNPKLKAFRTAASKTDASHSLHTLGSAVHANLLPDRRAIVAAWTNWEVALTMMLGVE